MAGSAAIVGCGAVKIGRYPDWTESDLALEAIRLALLDAGLEKDRVEGLYTTPDLQGNIGLQTNLLCEYLRIAPKSMFEICCGAIAGGLAVRYAVEEIASGRIEVAVCYGAEREASINWFKRAAAGQGASLYEPTAIQPYGTAGIIWGYAMSARRYMYETGATEEHFALAAVRNRKHARHSSVAAFTAPVTVEDVLRSRMLSSPIKLLDSSASLDGAAAVVVASARVAGNCRKKPVYVLGWGQHHDNSSFLPTDDCRKPIYTFAATCGAAREAFVRSGVRPEDVDVAEIYAPFSPHELMIPEDIGWFARGEMVEAIKKGETEIGGKIPINTDGGLISRGHPWAVTPFYETINIVKQLRGEAGQNQAPGAKVGLVHCEGGMLNNGLVLILGRD